MSILKTADVIAAEDTRTTGSLLKLLGLDRTGRLTSHHEHNTRRRVPEIVSAARLVECCRSEQQHIVL